MIYLLPRLISRHRLSLLGSETQKQAHTVCSLSVDKQSAPTLCPQHDPLSPRIVPWIFQCWTLPSCNPFSPLKSMCMFWASDREPIIFPRQHSCPQPHPSTGDWSLSLATIPYHPSSKLKKTLWLFAQRRCEYQSQFLLQLIRAAWGQNKIRFSTGSAEGLKLWHPVHRPWALVCT